MSRDKQIEEIDSLTSVIYEANHKRSVLDYHWLATEVCNNGYRKASDVAEEIRQDIIEPLWEAWKDNESQSTVILVEMILETINYRLKKIYIDKDTNVTTNTEET